MRAQGRRLGRFPYADGNIVTYLLSYTKQKGDMTTLHELLYKLSDGLSEDNLGEAGFEMDSVDLLSWAGSIERRFLNCRGLSDLADGRYYPMNPWMGGLTTRLDYS